MKLSELNAQIEELEQTVSQLEQVKATHWLKRPKEWQGEAAKLHSQLEAAKRRLAELWAWKNGNWYEDDIGAGGQSRQAPARSVR